MLKDRVLVVNDEQPVRDKVCEFLRQHNYEVMVTSTCAGTEQLARVAHPDAAIVDYYLPDGTALDLIARLNSIDPGIPVIVLTAFGSIDLALEAVKVGAEHFLTKPIELATLSLMLQRSIENQRNRQKQIAEKSIERRRSSDPFVGTSRAIAGLAESARQISSSECPILIEGEMGTGKGDLARWLHQNGPRASSPFLDLNCGALFREALETELFGYERTSSTGAVQIKTGLLEIARKGTLFLDDIGDVDAQFQSKLITVLDEKQFRRQGDHYDRSIDIRLIAAAATHHDLARKVREKSFRSDLYFRLSTVSLRIPPLRQRVEDIPLLASNILATLANDLPSGLIQISPGGMKMLQSYSWPGNVRELHNVLERAVLLNGGRSLSERDLHFDGESSASPSPNGEIMTLEAVERHYIEEVLFLEGGRVEPAARKLGIPRSSLYHKIKQYRIVRPGTSVTH